MQFRFFLLSCLFILLWSSISAQSTIVQSLTYDSTSRAMMVDFPTTDHKQYEKILMHYSMRCKDGLVSTGADRNRGCGEWDYSCNTYITDSTRVDSLRATSPSHVISGYSEDEFPYTTAPTQTYYRSELQKVIYNNTMSESEFDFDAGAEALSLPPGKENKIHFLYKKADLQSAGLTAGPISGLKMKTSSGSGLFPRMKIKMSSVNVSNLDGFTVHDENLQEVFFDDVEFVGSEIFFKFYQDFNWNGNDNILVEYSYSSADNQNLELEGGLTNYGSAFSINGEENASFFSDGQASVTIDQDINFEGEEISISFWYLGSDNLPVNTTLIEGVDENNARNVNIHIPWGDRNLYWDCGNDGTNYDRISNSMSELEEIKKWNHWTFTKNTNTGFMRVYKNGEPWLAGINKRRSIRIKSLRIASSIDGRNPIFATIDNMRIYDKELSQDEIKAQMSKRIAAGDGLYDNLVLAYDFNDMTTGQITDISANGFHGTIEGAAYPKYLLGRHQLSEANVVSILPDAIFVRGVYDRAVTNQFAIDSTENAPYRVTEYTVQNNDLITVGEFDYYLAGFLPVYDDDGELVDAFEVTPDDIIEPSELVYFNKRPSKFELVSFVTPYGIGIDFGLEGKTWVFDVTDFGPILTDGPKRLNMQWGGQFQEEMDIKFEFIEGTPIRDVESIQQVWPVSSEAFANLLSESRFEERRAILNPNATSYALKAAVTGHGQEGEFIPRDHYLNINGGARELQWQAWKECSDNAVYPQGGTWIYDRAGWCPGAPTDVQTLNLENVNPGEEVSIDYGVTTASGDSRYIINVQLVSYGDPNFTTDVELLDIINPSQKDEHFRFNPMCGAPRVMIRNTGANDLTSVNIKYGVAGETEKSFSWTGNLAFLESQEVELPPMNLAPSSDGKEFYARVESPNGVADEYANNNELTSIISSIPVQTNDIVVAMQTNNRPAETTWKLYDSDNNIIQSSAGGLVANRLYLDTISGLDGCYRLLIEDSDQDGISWWANTDGNGFVQIRDIGGASTTLATDFGMFVQHEFVTENFVPTSETPVVEEKLSVYPNPGFDIFTISRPLNSQALGLSIYNNQGEIVRQLEQKDIFSADIEVDLSSMPGGFYVAELKTTAGVISGKFLKL